jgi:nitrate reductase beta subunit
MRGYMRDINLGREPRSEIADRVGMTEEQLYEMYRLLAIAKHEDRYVIPASHTEPVEGLEEIGCSLDYEGGPGMYITGSGGQFGEASGQPVPASVETFHALRDRQTSDTVAGPDDKGARVNLLNWDGKGTPPGLFPPRENGEADR